MAAAARSNPFMGRLLKYTVHREVSIYWEEERKGVVFPCKARLDIISDVPGYGLLVCDLKSAASAHPGGNQPEVADHCPDRTTGQHPHPD